MGILYIVSTPIGNLEDITLRAIKVLNSVDIIACEDTRRTGQLLKKLEARNKRLDKPKLLSYFEHNEERRIPQIVSLLKQGKNMALVSNAGTPTISDPGFKLVRECIKEGIKVESIPGASAVLTALVSSGLPTDKFLFLGFLPKKKGKREKLLQGLVSMNQFMNTNIVFFESSQRLLQTLKEMKEIFGEIEVVICRELTKMHEEIKRGKITEIIQFYEQGKLKGEITIVMSIETEY